MTSLQKDKKSLIMDETEFGYIKWIQKRLKYKPEVIIGSGDDTAVIKIKSFGSKQNNSLLYATTDTIVEGIDFHISSATPEQIGYKSVAVSLSDLAAMGGGFSKIYALISASLPKNLAKPHFTHPLFQGINYVSKRFNVQIIGGDISSTRGPITITSTLFGIDKGLKPIRRNGACEGDALLVTGKLGGSILNKHLSFTPRLREAELLNRHYKINSMIDISDGLLADLDHILEASNVGALLDTLSIPISPEAYKLAKQNKIKSLNHAFSDGEDFELLFTTPIKEAVQIIHDKRLAKTPISIIGLIRKQKGIFLCNSMRKTSRIAPQGFKHF
jgi:thiamine-monophosphate kinase